MSEPSVRVLVATSFGPDVAADGSGELGRWLDGYGEFSREVSVAGVPDPVYITDHGVGVTVTGMGPAHAAASVTACLAADDIDTDQSYVLTAGVAGISPHVGTVGSVVLADHVVNWDAKKRYDDHSVEPWGFGPPHAYTLNDAFVAAAEQAASGVELDDTPAAQTHRERYSTTAAVGSPGIETGTSVAGADFWYGHSLAADVADLVETYDAGTYATTECEGFGTAVACDRFGLLDRYLSVRAAANFDRPPKSGDSDDSDWRMKGAAFRNAYLAGRAIADEIAGNWGDWRDGPPDPDTIQPASLDI